jgi:hypothetical protein
MDPDTVIAALKIAGALVGGVLGVMGVLLNFKRPDNRLTGWGVLVLIGIALSAAAGVFGSIAEAYKAKSEAALQSARTETLLKELSRTVQPITQLEITYWATVPSDAPGVQAYVDRVSKAIEAQKDQLRQLVFLNEEDIQVTAFGLNDEPLTIDLGLHSSLWPRGNEPPVGDVALEFSLSVFLRKTPIKTEDFRAIVGTDGPDVADWLATALPSVVGGRGRNRLIFDRRTKSLEVFGTSEFPKAMWHSNGKITSIVDLYGAQLIFLPPNALNVRLPPKWAQFVRPKVAELTRTLNLKTVVLKFREGRSLWISGKALKKSEFKGGYPAFSIVLPTDEAGFIKLVSRDE